MPFKLDIWKDSEKKEVARERKRDRETQREGGRKREHLLKTTHPDKR